MPAFAKPTFRLSRNETMHSTSKNGAKRAALNTGRPPQRLSPVKKSCPDS
ncbi:hypothetical protein SBC1_50940 (plasmid) [Caballeronia sp. SBC1]|nr:hypothetical protein SBC2_37040 [Caballeronia sp. SBC2]QIN65054.1 hypothetical protein SBC1_50940 [Caballeronia sp. SBC1]